MEENLIIMFMVMARGNNFHLKLENNISDHSRRVHRLTLGSRSSSPKFLLVFEHSKSSL
jgi:hypothetical protein